MKIYLVEAEYHSSLYGHNSRRLRIFTSLEVARQWVLQLRRMNLDYERPVQMVPCPDNPHYFSIKSDPLTGNRWSDSIGSITIHEEELHSSPLQMLAEQAE